MSDYRRWFVAGGTFFFTVVVHQRSRLFDNVRAVSLLGNVMRESHSRWPMTVNAIVLLPDHLHAMWTLPSGDDQYPKRWGWIKKEFTKAWLDSSVGQAVPDANGERFDCQAQPDLQHAVRQASSENLSPARRRERRRDVWQPRYWEHTIKDEDDFERHFDYIHWNPVKHGYVHCPHEWRHSSFHRYVEQGVYDRGWGCFGSEPPARFRFQDIRHTTGE